VEKAKQDTRRGASIAQPARRSGESRSRGQKRFSPSPLFGKTNLTMGEDSVLPTKLGQDCRPCASSSVFYGTLGKKWKTSIRLRTLLHQGALEKSGNKTPTAKKTKKPSRKVLGGPRKTGDRGRRQTGTKPGQVKCRKMEKGRKKGINVD